MISPDSFILYFLLMGFSGTLLSGYIVCKGDKPWWATLLIMFVIVFMIGVAVTTGEMPVPTSRDIWTFLVFMPWLLAVRNAVDVADANHNKKVKDVEAQTYRECVANRKAQSNVESQ